MKQTTRIPIFLFLALWLIGLPLMAQNDLKSLNQALRYSRYSRVGLKIIPLKVSDTDYRAQFVVEKIEENPEFSSYSFSVTLLTSYDQDLKNGRIISLSDAALALDTDRHWVFEKTISVSSDQEQAILLFSALDNRQGDTYAFHIDLKSPFVTDHPSVGAYYANEVPFDQNFLVAGQSLLFKTTQGPGIHSFFFPKKFDLPYPPMETKTAPVPKEIEVIDEGDFLENIPKELASKGYYFMQQDTSKARGLLIKTTHESFPRVNDWDEMVEMVTYISTRKEHETLLTARDKKKALDTYWIQLTRSPELAKELIREYFRQIEFANLLFTDFKEGWKTDKGMVYIVMGPPEEVYFDLDQEIWSYQENSTSPKIKFTFARVKNMLTPHYYTLNRSRAYQPIWFKNISLWRNGRMAF